MRLEADSTLTNRIKWYVQPILFGGDPSAEDNIRWMPMDEHAEIVKWWNKFYYDTFGKEWPNTPPQDSSRPLAS